MKIRKSQSYLIVSSCFLGIDEEILAIFANFARHYKAEVIHLGPTVSDKDYALRERLIKSLSSCSKPEMKAKILSQIKEIEDKEHDNITIMLNKFNKLSLITQKNMSILKHQKSSKRLKIYFSGKALSKYLYLSPVPPKTDKNTRILGFHRRATHLKRYGKSWILPHPVPAVECHPKPGLNESYNYWVVGGMSDIKYPEHHSQIYIADHLPAAIFVLVDCENAEFHARHIHIDSVDGVKFAADDGLVFFKNRVKEAPSTDRATMSTDDHAPYYHRGTLACLRALNELYKPHTFINGGDAADFASVSRHTEDLPGAIEGLRLVDELRSLRRLLDAQTHVSSIKEKVLIDSNHHEWVTRFVMKNPALIGLLDWPNIARAALSDWNVLIRDAGDNKIYYYGDYMVRHGDKDGGVGKAELATQNGKYICGHFHNFKVYKRSIQMGCGAQLGPVYTGNQINAWQSQIASFTRYKNVASVAPKIVLHDKVRKKSRFSFRDKIYEVNYYTD